MNRVARHCTRRVAATAIGPSSVATRALPRQPACLLTPLNRRSTVVAGVRCCSTSTPVAPTAVAQDAAVSANEAPSTEQPITLTAKEFARLAPMILLQEALQQYTLLDGTLVADRLAEGSATTAGSSGSTVNHTLISRERFNELCVLSHVEDSEAALAALHDAAKVVSLAGGTLVHLRPVQFVEQLQLVQQAETVTSESVPSAAPLSSGQSHTPIESFTLPESFLLVGAQQRLAELERAEEEMRAKLNPAIARAARWRRTVWGAALLYAGTQLAVISRLTFFDLDWDIMEPVSYCLDTAIALLFYVYFLCAGKDHSYSGFDQRFLPRRVRRYAPKDFDWNAYNSLVTQVDEQEQILERLRKWAETH